MYIEYYINSIDEKDIQIKSNIDEVIKYPISGILAPYSQAKFIKKNYPTQSVGCLIDYPISSCDPGRRSDLINDAIKIDINYVCVTVPFYYIINRKYDKFREDIKKNLELCNSHNIDIRYVLEYRKFDHALLTKICEILLVNNIKTIYPSTGFFLDNLEDNIIAASYLKQKTGISVIINGNLWTARHAESLIKANSFGFSCNNAAAFKLLDKKTYEIN
jgi:deoxyribose-phosphate aldolase